MNMIRRFCLMLLVVTTALALPFAMADEKKEDKKKDESAKSAEKSSKDGDKKDETAKGKGEGKKEEPKFTAKCPVSGEAATKEQKAAYREKDVYFCCEKCKAAFEADSAKFATKANHQLVQTRQFVQTKCPLSGGDINKEQFARVSGVKVSFCCDKCKGSIESATKDDQIAKIFADEVFTKAFEARKKKADGSGEKGEKKKDAGKKSESAEKGSK
jgi:YHS domain-containing protein